MPVIWQRKFQQNERFHRNSMLEDYMVVDLEMTGLDPKTDRILEIGAVKVQGKQITDRFSVLVRPERPIDEKISKLTGITDEMAAKGEDLDLAVREFLDFAEDFTWVGHNIMFDYRFIKQWEVNHRIKRNCYAADTLKIARKCLPQLEKKSLEYLCDHYGITRETSHRAYEDAAANQILYEILEKDFGEKEPGLFCGKELQCRLKRQTPATLRQKNYLKDLAEYHRIVLDVPLEQLSRSEASRLTDQIISKYGNFKALAEPGKRTIRP